MVSPKAAVLLVACPGFGASSRCLLEGFPWPHSLRAASREGERAKGGKAAKERGSVWFTSGRSTARADETSESCYWEDPHLSQHLLAPLQV